MKTSCAILIISLTLIGCSKETDQFSYYGEDVYITSNAELVAFGRENYQLILGRLTIERSEDIANLESLSTLRQVTNGVFIQNNSQLTSLSGLENLNRVREQFVINGNPALTDLEGLSGIGQIDGGLTISYNPMLTSIDGLSNLRFIEENLILRDNAVSSLSALSHLSTLNALQISNEKITNLEGLQNLDTVRSYIKLSNNRLLTDIKQIQDLQSFNGGLSLVENQNLNALSFPNLTQLSSLLIYGSQITTLEGFRALTHVDDLLISRNPNLISLNGPDELTKVVSVLIELNPKLEDFCSLSFPALELKESHVYICENAYNPTLAQLKTGECSR